MILYHHKNHPSRLLRVAHLTRPKISSKFVDSCLSHPAERQTHKGKNITSSVEVTTYLCGGYNYDSTSIQLRFDRATTTRLPTSRSFIRLRGLLRRDLNKFIFITQKGVINKVKNINYCVRGGHKPARWPWPTSPMP